MTSKAHQIIAYAGVVFDAESCAVGFVECCSSSSPKEVVEVAMDYGLNTTGSEISLSTPLRGNF